MATTTRTTKAGPISRSITISFALAGKVDVRVSESQNGKTTTDGYTLSRQESQMGGIAFKVRKDEDGESYDVLLNAPGGGHTCDCKWGTYKGHVKPCRHVEMCLQAIRERKV